MAWKPSQYSICNLSHICTIRLLQFTMLAIYNSNECLDFSKSGLCTHQSVWHTKMPGQVHFQCTFYLVLLTNHYHCFHCLQMQYLLGKCNLESFPASKPNSFLNLQNIYILIRHIRPLKLLQESDLFLGQCYRRKKKTLHY